MTKLTVAALQLAFTDNATKNILAVADLVREAASKGAEVVLPPILPVYYLPVPDFVDEPELVVSELPVEPVVPLPVVPLPVVLLELPEPLVLGDERVGDPLMPPAPEPVVGLEVLVPASLPSVVSRSEHAPRPSVASAAATATPIARVLICFIHHS